MDASRETCLAVITGKATKVLYTDRLFLCVSRRCHSTTSWEITTVSAKELGRYGHQQILRPVQTTLSSGLLRSSINVTESRAW